MRFFRVSSKTAFCVLAGSINAVIKPSLKLQVACSTPSTPATILYAAKLQALQSRPTTPISIRTSLSFVTVDRGLIPKVLLLAVRSLLSRLVMICSGLAFGNNLSASKTNMPSACLKSTDSSLMSVHSSVIFRRSFLGRERKLQTGGPWF